MNKEKIKYVTLSQIVKRVKVGFVGSIEKFYCNKDDGILLLRTNNLTPLGIDYSNVKYVTKDFFEKNKKSQLHKNDILIARHGDNGKANIYELDEEAQALNVVIIEPNNEKMSSTLIKYLFDSPYVKKQISSSVSGSVQNVINTKQIENLEIPIFESINYKKIESILKNIDNKIKLNNKINSELENMAKTIYDYWFLQFEFPSNEGKPYKSSGGKMVWNEELKKEIPEGWEVKELKNFIDIVRGITYSKEDISLEEKENYFPLLKSNNIQNGKINYNNIIYVKNSLVSEKQILDKGSIFITMSSGSKEHMGKTAIIFDDLKYTFGAFCSKIKIKKDFIAFISLFLISKLFKNIIDNLTLGTSINNINNDHINNIKIAIPNKKILKLFEDKIRGIFEKQGKIIFENQELTSLRDYLLPLLMNGQVGFKD